jgi:hypothetical protein
VAKFSIDDRLAALDSRPSTLDCFKQVGIHKAPA